MEEQSFISNIEDRWYQREAKDAILRDIDNFNPLIAVPTGGGKTIILGRFIYDFLEMYPFANILVLADVQEILEQNHSTIQKFFPGIKIGLYSSGLKSRTIHKITVAGIQSVYNKPHLFSRFQVIFIDEAHTIPFEEKSMYRKFFNSVKARYVGMSATVYRRGIGMIHEGKDRIFDKLSYDLTSRSNFNRLIDEGYLSRLYSKPTNYQLDSSDIKTSIGDYNLKQLSEKHDRALITKEAISEAIRFGKNYKSWLVFAIDIAHADHITDELNNNGIESMALHQKTSKFRKEIINKFKNQEIRAVVSVGMVTTGFDAPNIDLIILLRPTKSAVLHVQMIGRGLRIFPGKDHCLVLDFAGNISRLGPINDVLIPRPKNNGSGSQEPPIKTCPDCGSYNHTLAKLCEVCGHEFKFKQKIKPKADFKEVVSVNEKKWLNVDSVQYQIHVKPGRPNSLMVIYRCGLQTIKEYICLEHGGYAQRIAENWLLHRWDGDKTVKYPRTVSELFEHRDFIRKPTSLKVQMSAKYLNIIDVGF